MADASLVRRVDHLEEAMARVARELAELRRDMNRHYAETERASRELRAEMQRLFSLGKGPASVTVTRSRSTFAPDSAAPSLVTETKADWRARQRAMRQDLGELCVRLGTLAQSLVAPEVDRVFREVVGVTEDEDLCVAEDVRRQSAERPGVTAWFDVVAVCGDYALVNETKSRLMPEDIPAFIERLADVRVFFPELADQRILGAIASLYVDESLVRLGERQGLIVLGFGEDLMDVLNAPGFVPREF